MENFMREEVSNQIINDSLDLKINVGQQKTMARTLSCLDIPYNQLAIGGSLNEGNQMFENVAKLAISAFDATCSNLINKMTLSNIESTIIKINTEYEKVNKNLEVFEMQLLDDYLDLKIKQCRLQEKILFNKKQLKEIEQTEKEIIKEQLQEEKRIQKEQDKLEKELVNLQYKFNKQLENDKIYDTELKQSIENIEERIKENEYALTHKRAGYVYVVSNDDMKDGQYKIGITRRSVEERMKELGSGASHSFGMNVHGYTYCDDCFEVESALHRYFSKQRVNQLNPRKEWFRTTLPEIQNAFKELFDINIVLEDTNNEDYLYSKQKKEQKT